MDRDELYQAIVLDHYRHPRHAGPVTPEEASAEEVNPSCGDFIRLRVEADAGGRILSVRHESRGCVIATASASILAEFAVGRTISEFRACAESLIAAMRGEREWVPGQAEALDALAGIRHFPMRVNCAALGWRALQKALETRGSSGPRYGAAGNG